MNWACPTPGPTRTASTASALRHGVIMRSYSSPPTARQRFGAMSGDARREGEPTRHTHRSYRAAYEAIYDHFVGSGHFVALEPYPEDRLQEVTAGRHVGEPCRKNDHVVGTLFTDEAEHAALALAAIRNDLGRHQAHEIDDGTARNVGDGADVVERQAAVTRNVLCNPVAEAHLHRVDVLHGPPVARSGRNQAGERQGQPDRGENATPSRPRRRERGREDDEGQWEQVRRVSPLLECGAAVRRQERHGERMDDERQRRKAE